MTDAKVICDEIKAFYRERSPLCPHLFANNRAAAEEDYAKKLLKVSKMPLGTKECGTLKTSLVSVKTELEAMASAHAEVAANMRRELEEALGNMAASMKEMRKMVFNVSIVLIQVMANIEKLRRTKQAQEHALTKVSINHYEADD
jgi:hypothetical protein